LIAILTPKEIERKRMLISKFKEDAINRIEIQELVNILKKEEAAGGNDMLVFAISPLISNLSEYLTSRSGIKEDPIF
jgi:hypothetical protein